MIQVNLIPDLKAQYLKAQRNKRLVMGISFIVSASFIGLVVLMFLYVNGVQARHTAAVEKDIQESIDELNTYEDLDKVITVQNQLATLPSLHQDKPRIARLVNYLSIFTPEGPEYQTVEMSFETEQIQLIGRANDPEEVETLAKTLREAFYIIDGDEATKGQAFQNIVLSNTSNEQDDKITFEVGFSFDPVIFSSQEIELKIPRIDATNSELLRPRIDPEVFRDQESE